MFVESIRKEEKSMTLVNFLKRVIVASLKRLVKVVEMEIRKNGTVSTLIVGTPIFIMKEMKMEKGLRLFQILLQGLFAEKGQEVPENITKMFALARTSASVVTVPVPVPAPIRQPVAMAQPPTPATKPAVRSMAPARTLGDKPFILANSLKTWTGFLTGIVRGSNVPWKVLQNLTAKIFVVATKSQIDWGLLFAAMKKANENGQHIVNNDARPAAIFAMAPVELVDDYLFGQDGIVLPLIEKVSDCKGDMPGYIQARCSICLDAIEAVHFCSILGEHEKKIVDRLLDAVEDKDGPHWLIQRGEDVVSGKKMSSPAAPAGSTASIGEILKAKIAKAAAGSIQ